MRKRSEHFSTAMSDGSPDPNNERHSLLKRANIAIDKQTFDTIKLMREKGDRRNMFELIYRNKHTGLRTDSRLTYFSFFTVMSYPEVKVLMLFSALYTANLSINTILSHPL